VQGIGIAAARVTAASRAGNSSVVYLEFRGLRDAPHVADKDTRIRVALSLERAADLLQRLAALLPPPEETPAFKLNRVSGVGVANSRARRSSTFAAARRMAVTAEVGVNLAAV